MIILKPEKGFAIPVEYMNNDRLYNEDLRNHIYRVEYRAADIDKEEKKENALFGNDDNEELIEDRVINDKIIYNENVDDIKEGNKDVVAAVVDKNSSESEDGSGVLVFEDENDIEIDENKSVELEQARNNYRKAIEVEIEKVGKLVLDDEEIKIDSKMSEDPAKADEAGNKTDIMDKNISADDLEEKNVEVREENSDAENKIEGKIVKESEDK